MMRVKGTLSSGQAGLSFFPPLSRAENAGTVGAFITASVTDNGSWGETGLRGQLVQPLRSHDLLPGTPGTGLPKPLCEFF